MATKTANRFGSQFLLAFILLFIAGFSMAQEQTTVAKGKYFEVEQELVKKDFVEYDFVEFSLFDLSGVEIQVLKPVDAKMERDSAREQELATLAKQKLPKHFYKSLRDKIVKLKVPVTLYPTDAPQYARPLKLSIRVKQITISPIAGRRGSGEELFLRIYGQIRDKSTNEIMLKFYDSGKGPASEDVDELNRTLEMLAEKTMDDLSRYLKSKY